jgi:hypothetical protein
MPTFQTQYGGNNLNDVDLGIGRLDIAEYSNQLFRSVGFIEGTATGTLNRTNHMVKAGTPMSTIVVFAVDEEGNFKIEPLEVGNIQLAETLLGQPTSNFTLNSAASATTTNEAASATLGAWVPLGNDNLVAVYTVKNSTGSITYTAGVDYLVDLIHGEIFYEGANIQNGQLVLVTYGYNLPLSVMTYGGYSSVRNYRLYWSHQRPQDSNYEVLEAYKCVGSLNWVKSYIQNSHNKFPMQFDFLADITRNQGDRIARLRTQTQQPF